MAGVHIAEALRELHASSDVSSTHHRFRHSLFPRLYHALVEVSINISIFLVVPNDLLRTTAFPHPFIGPPLETPRANALS